MSRRTEKGSVFVYIFLAVALFASLGYAVTQMMRGGADLGAEKAAIYADGILGFSRQINDAVKMMRISNNCEDTGFSFEKSPFDGSVTDYVNANAPTDFSCHVFHPDGGGVSFQAPMDQWLETSSPIVSQPQYKEILFMGQTCVPAIGNGTGACWSDGQDNEELIMFVPFIKKEICQVINERIGINGIPTDNGCGWAWSYRYIGGYGEALSINSTSVPTATNEAFWGKASGCYRATNAGCNWLPDSYHFYQVILPR